jgi:ABC-type glycerol-3-phosphate transport system substrate-binding protein
MKRLLIVPLLLLTLGLGCSPSVATRPASSKPLTLEFWLVADNTDIYEETLQAYRVLHPNVAVNFRKFRLEEYEREILNALAEDRGPDILQIHNTWTRGYKSKLQPMPAQMKLAYREIQGSIKPEAVWVEKTKNSMTVGQLRNNYVDQVAEDVVLSAPTANPQQGLVDQIFGLPLALDTMVMFHNKDVLNASGIPLPAQSWNELVDHVTRLTKLGEQGELVRPAVGLGTARNVDRYFDILSALMLQNGAQMTDENGLPTFHQVPPNMNREVPPAVEALIFYNKFANPTDEAFTWDDAQPNSYDAFIAGKTAYFFGYAYHLDRIRSDAPKLNLGVTSMPLINPAFKRYVANYWLLSASKKTKFPNEAWDFIQFLAAEPQVKNYLARYKRPAALKSLVNTQATDDDLGPFATQVLTAKSWYKGVNIQATEDAFAEMIEAVLAGTEPERAVRFAVDAIAQTVRE